LALFGRALSTNPVAHVWVDINCATASAMPASAAYRATCMFESALARLRLWTPTVASPNPMTTMMDNTIRVTAIDIPLRRGLDPRFAMFSVSLQRLDVLAP